MSIYFQMPLECRSEINKGYENKDNTLKNIAMASLPEEMQTCFLMDKSYLSLLTSQFQVRLTFISLSIKNKEEAS